MIHRRPLASLNISKDAYLRVSQNLDRIVKGDNAVISSPILEDIPDSSVLAGWDKIYQANLSKVNSSLDAIEQNNRSKFGPRSIAKPWTDRRDGILKDFYGDSKLGYNLEAVIPPSDLGRLRPLSPANALPFLKNSTAGGLPLMRKKGIIKPILLDNFEIWLKQRWPANLYTRTQEAGKTRNVVGPGIADILFEMMYYRPLLDYQRKLPWRSALNTPEEIDSSVTKLFELKSKFDLSIVSIDFSKYDQTVKGGLQHAGFQYIRSLYQKRYHNDLYAIEERFKNIELITPDGILSGPHGVPSGSTFTNEIDSIVQYLVASNCNDVKFVDRCMIQGDDGLYLVKDQSGAESLFSCFQSYGLEVNEDKSIVSSEYATYLQNLYHPDYSRDGKLVGVYSTYRALCRICFLERFDDFQKDGLDGKDYFAIRTISILENCKFHPLFRELVEYVVKLDKYSLKYSDHGLASYVKRKADQEGKDVRFGQWQYGDSVNNLRKFETVRLLAEMT